MNLVKNQFLFFYQNAYLFFLPKLWETCCNEHKIIAVLCANCIEQPNTLLYGLCMLFSNI